MKILIVGTGGREHALAWKLGQDHEVICAPGNPGIASIAECLPLAWSEPEALVREAKSIGFDLVVIGPEDPLINGLADRLRAAGVATFGPGADGARLEGSKAFSKDLMSRAGIPTSPFRTFTTTIEASAYAQERFDKGKRVVVKASGNALGKGVVVCDEPAEAEAAIRRMVDDRVFGDAGSEVVVEDRLAGPEFSLLTVVSDGDYRSLPVAQDYKRAYDYDEGPNTGGMGSYSPPLWVTPDLVRRTESQVVEPILRAMAKDGISYRGVLFSGLMVDDGVPYCLEYNCRFGDPETQSVMRRLGSGLGEALRAAALGEPISTWSVIDNAAVTVVLASEGYPDNPIKGTPITVGKLPDEVLLFHSGTGKSEGGELLTSGGRVLGVSAVAGTVGEARARAYEGVQSIGFRGMQFRSDIARP